MSTEPLPAPVPSRDEFRRLARSQRVVPLRTTLLADQITPVAMFRRLCGDGPGFLLESVDHGGKWGRWSLIGRAPLGRLVLRDGRVHASGELSQYDGAEGVLDVLDHLVERFAVPPDDTLAPLHSGLVGYLGYDVVREVERLPSPPADDRRHPDSVMSMVGELVALDHWSQHATLMVNVVVDEHQSDADIDASYDRAVAALERLVLDGATPLDEPLVSLPESAPEPIVATSTLGSARYRQAVEAAKEHIAAGDIFQVVLSQRFDFETSADPFDIYRVLRQTNPSPYMFFVREPELTLVGCSPEPMVQLLDGRVISRPIAGTRWRGATEDDDRRLAAELKEHPKERAEHIMLVDLARNDVGRVVEFGTEQVDELLVLERYSHVMHLTSQVSGRLAASKTAIDVLRATLPAGTVSGAPKVRAMEIIDDFEVTRRGPYAGIVGYLDFSGNVDTAIAIRTMVLDRLEPSGPWRGSVQAGAGVVADSIAEYEDLECANKARALLCAVPPAELMTAQRSSAARQGSDPG